MKNDNPPQTQVNNSAKKPEGDAANSSAKSISLKTTLAAVVLVIVGATAAVIHFPWTLTSKRNTANIVKRLNQEIAQGTTDAVRTLSENALVMQETIQEMFAKGTIGLDEPEIRQDFYLTLLKANQNFSGINFGYPNGNFFAAQRLPSGKLRFINSVWNPEEKQANRTVSFYEIAEQGLKLTDEEKLQDRYNPVNRPWYQKASSSSEAEWAGVYIFHTSQKPGITSSIAVRPDNALIGVVSIDVELEQLSVYLQNLQVAKTGAVFIIDTEQKLVGFSDPSEPIATANEAGEPNLKPLAESENKYLRFARNVIEAEGVSLDKVDSLEYFAYKDPDSGDKYFVSFLPLQNLKNLNLIVGTVIPESDFVGEINRNNQRLFVAMAVLIILAAGAAIILSDKAIATPILRITKAAEDIEEDKFELKSLESVSQRSDELGRLARVFKEMARQVYQREQKLKQQVQELRIEIDQSKKQKQVSEITNTDFFQDLQKKAKKMRKNRENKDSQE
ncbi:MAG: HAMP domain-containing protein [Oscillatoria sp. SIO1A7]|nr:HAMP domain-containing protein [Oscillatoria sp. SIO1A7]